MLKSIDEIVGVAGGTAALSMAALGSGELNPEIVIATAVAASTLISEFSEQRQRHGPETVAALKRARQAVSKAEERWKHSDPVAIAEWDLALKRLLPGCMLDRRKLAESAFAPGGFPIAACDVILKALVGKEGWQRGNLAANAGLGGRRVDGNVFVEGEARAFAQDVILAALEATYHDKKYFQEIAPYIAFEQAAATGRIELNQVSQGEDIAELTANMRTLMKALGFDRDLRERQFTEVGIEQIAQNFGSIAASDNAKADELRFTIDSMTDADEKSQGVADLALNLARSGDFSGASKALRGERDRLRDEVKVRQDWLKNILDITRTVERLQQDPLATAQMIYDELGGSGADNIAARDGLFAEASRRCALPSLFERRVAEHLYAFGLERPENSSFRHAAGWWRRQKAEAIASQHQFGGGVESLERAAALYLEAEEDCAQAGFEFEQTGHLQHAEAAALDCAITARARVTTLCELAHRRWTMDPINRVVSQLEKRLEWDRIRDSDRASACIYYALSELFTNAHEITKNTDCYDQSRTHILDAIERIDRTIFVNDRINFRLLEASQLTAGGNLTIAKLLRAMQSSDDAFAIAEDHNLLMSAWAKQQRARIYSSIDYLTGGSQYLPDAIKQYEEIKQNLEESDLSRTWWYNETGLSKAVCTLAALEGNKNKFLAGADALERSLNLACESNIADEAVHYGEICDIAKIGRKKVGR